MQDLFTYLLKSSGLLIAFFISYHFLLRKETFFASNRWFLIAGLITSALLPLYFIKKIKWIEKPKFTIDDLLQQSNALKPSVITNEPVTIIDWTQIITIGYFLVVLFLISKVIVNSISLFRLLKNKKIQKYDSFTFVDIQEDIAPFSFFNFIVFNSNLYTQSELESILLHEKVHSQQKHSFDVLIAKLFCIVLWFNPFIWLYKKAIVQNLEYIADNKAVQLIEDKKAYQKTLLKVVSHQNCLPITNHFYQSLIKKRIVMLNKNQSHKRNSWKYAVVIPALIAFVFLFQVKVVAQEKEEFQTQSDTERVTFMDWNKDTPNEELNNDIKELQKLGITVKYSKLKRNENGEITAIKVDFQDNEGNSGTTQFNGKKPIKPIHFYKTENGIGFGEPKRRTVITTNNDEGATLEYHIGANDNSIETVVSEVPEPPTPPNPNEIEEKVIIKKNGADAKKRLIIINGQKYDEKTLNNLDPINIETIDVLKDDNATKIYGKEGENGVIVVRTKVFEDKNDRKAIIFSNDNGDDIVITDNYKLFKVPGNPAVQLTENSPVLIVNGNVQSNPKSTLEIIDIDKIKSVRIFDENDKETKGTAIKKIVITTN